MTSMNVDHGRETRIAGTESRREALKRFGRYAAVAPTTMLLLGPRMGHAHHFDWHTPPGPLNNPGGGGGSRGGGDYDD